MAAPVVQDLGQILAELEPAYGASRNIYNEQIGGLQGAEDTAINQLNYKKDNSFRDIARSANSRGLDFWGIPIEEQGRYLGEQYLPGIANVKANTIKSRQTLGLALADLEKDKYTRGLDTRSQQQKALQEYEREQRQVALEREKMAQTERLQRAQIAASRGGGGGKASNKEMFAAGLAEKAGKDGKVDPGTYNALKNQWVAAGYGDYKSFHDQYWRFANDKHWWDYR